ncbi:hypothetical protein [Streptomyces sp. NPDC002580]
MTLRQADDAARAAGPDTGVMEDWRAALELAARHSARLGTAD